MPPDRLHEGAGLFEPAWWLASVRVCGSVLGYLATVAGEDLTWWCWWVRHEVHVRPLNVLFDMSHLGT